MNRYAVPLAVSVVINAVVLYSFDHATLQSYKEVLKQVRLEQLKKQRDSLSFEFVEAPPKAHPDKPRSTRRISDRDALDQDLNPDKTAASSGPAAKRIGLADQLEQKMGSSPRPYVPPVQVAKTWPRPKEKQRESTEPEKTKTSSAALAPAPMEKPVELKEKAKPQRKPEPRKSAQEPHPEILGAPGGQKINTQESARQQHVSAKFFGFTSFETTGSGMGEYMKNVKEKVWLSWFPYLSFSYPSDYRSADAVIGIRLDKLGNVRQVRVIASEGDPLFATYCMDALQRVGSFGAVPKDITAILEGEELEIKFGFHYR